MIMVTNLVHLSLAHEDSIWTVAWGTSDKDGIENIITGAVDDMVKCWRWLVFSHFNDTAKSRTG